MNRSLAIKSIFKKTLERMRLIILIVKINDVVV